MKNEIMVGVLLAASTVASVVQAEPSLFEVVAGNDVQLQPLNPLRGDAGPQAAVLWGDIAWNGPTGTLIRFVEGFASPPHIHNVTYRAVVISGALHNDDPDAATMWMEPGSFWTQPAGETHITAASDGPNNLAFLEILEGPYLVRPPSEEFDNGERPINIEARNIVWIDAADTTWIETADDTPPEAAPQLAFLWGDPRDGERNGTFLKLPAGYSGELTGSDAWLRAVTIEGEATHEIDGKSSAKRLTEGSYFGSEGDLSHTVSCGAEGECVFYLSTTGKYRLIER